MLYIDTLHDKNNLLLQCLKWLPNFKYKKYICFTKHERCAKKVRLKI